MQTNFNSNQNFGMALRMQKASKIEKALGKRLAEEAEIARPRLKELAKDVDIIVSPHENSDLACRGFDIQVEDTTPNSIKRFLFGPDRYVKDSVRNYDAYGNKRMSDVLVKEVANLKEKFLKYTS